MDSCYNVRTMLSINQLHTCTVTGKRPAGTAVLKGLLSHDTSRKRPSGEESTLQDMSESSWVCECRFNN